LTWTSDDNYFAEDAVESMVTLLQPNKKIDFVYANFYIINDDGKVLQSVSVVPSKNLKEYNCIGPCFLYRRKIYEVIGGYNPDAFLVEDYEYWIRIFKRFRMQKLDKFIYWHRLHPRSLTGKYAAEAKRRADRVRDHYFKVHAMRRRILSFISNNIRSGRRVFRAFLGVNKRGKRVYS
jgi:hypothetical protein